MKLAFASLLLSLVPRALSLSPIGHLFDDLLLHHRWCCVDAFCATSCWIFEDQGGDYKADFPAGSNVDYNQVVALDSGDFSLFQIYLNSTLGAEWCQEYMTYLGVTKDIDGVSTPYVCRQNGRIWDDPHVQTWGGEFFDFQGECDLTFLSAPNFGKGLGLDIQVRTKIRYQYSFIESAALKIGDDILEVGSWGEYFLNDLGSADLSDATLGGYNIEHSQPEANKTSFDIHIEGGQVVRLRTFKDFVDVEFQNVAAHDFGGSYGLLGSYPEGKKLARDGKTEIEDPIEFGQEWQVLAGEPFWEPSLFLAGREPQYPQKCRMPDPEAKQSRRLGETVITEAEAKQACSHLNGAEKKMCIFDVMATGDLDMAKSGRDSI